MKKKIFTICFLITVLFIAVQPSKNNLRTSWGSDLDIGMIAATTNYSKIENFIFQYKNTVSGWFGKYVDDLNRTYMLDSTVEGDWFLMFGKFLPYLCILVIIILFLLPRTYNKDKA